MMVAMAMGAVDVMPLHAASWRAGQGRAWFAGHWPDGLLRLTKVAQGAASCFVKASRARSELIFSYQRTDTPCAASLSRWDLR